MVDSAARDHPTRRRVRRGGDRGGCLTRPITAPVVSATTRARGLPAITIADRPSGLGTTRLDAAGQASRNRIADRLARSRVETHAATVAERRARCARRARTRPRPRRLGAPTALVPTRGRSAGQRRPASDDQRRRPRRSSSSDTSGRPTSMIARSRDAASVWRSASSARGFGSTRAASSARASPSSGSLSTSDSALAASCPLLAMRACSRASLRCESANDRERGRERKPDERAEREEAEPAMASPRLLPCARRRPAPRRAGSSSRAPRRRGRRGRSPSGRSRRFAGCGGSRASSTTRPDLRLRCSGELREVGGLVRDLRPRGRDEVVEERALRSRAGRASARRSRARGGRRRSGRRRRARRASPARSVAEPRAALDVPEALHHELEVRRLDPAAATRSARRRRGRPGRARSGPVPTPSSTRSTSTSSATTSSPSSSPHRSSGRTIAARPAARSSRSRRRTFPKRFGIRALEPVEPRERVLAQREEDVDAQRPVHQLRERRARSRPRRRGT